MRPACKTFGRWLVIAAMMSAFGGHWLVLQSVAWTTIVIANARHANLGQALEQTFDGRHPCALCNSIKKGRQSEKKQDAQAAFGKIDFFYQTGVLALVSPVNTGCNRLVTPLPGTARSSPSSSAARRACLIFSALRSALFWRGAGFILTPGCPGCGMPATNLNHLDDSYEK